MRLARWNTAVGSIFLAAILSVPAWSANTDKRFAMPGTLNYVEGQASIGEQTLNSKAVGSAELQAGQTLDTENGKAEILLTPGVFLRLGSNSSVKMISPDLTNTELALNQGEALLEVDEIHSQNDIRITQPGASTRVLKTGLYDFDSSNHEVRVFDGKARVQANDHEVTVKGGHELALNTEGKLKARSFDKKEVEQSDDLYRWSSLRSEYLSEANVETARTYFADGWYGPGWFGAGWYWNPWFGGFTFLPADGFFYNPFGWGFYSPLVVYRAPIVVGHFPHRFDGFRPAPALGSGFHDHGVRFFGRSAPIRGFHRSPPMRAPSAPAFRPRR
jgi:FecR protein